MTTRYAHVLARRCELLQLELPWLASDLLKEFDAWLRVPLHDSIAFSRQCVEFFEWKLTISSPTPVGIVDERFEKLCGALERRGENVDRLCLWLASGSSRHILRLPERPSEALWSPVLKNWCTRGPHPSSLLNEPPLREFLASYKREAWRPLREFEAPWQPRREAWESEDDDAGRSARDDEIFRAVTTLRDGVPHLPLDRFYGLALDRTWWRRHRDTLSEEDHETLLSELVRHLQNDSWADVLNWNDVRRLDEAFDLEKIPDFDEFKRDW